MTLTAVKTLKFPREFMKDQGDQIIVLKHFDNAIDANIAKTKLDAYGIPCFLTEENISNLYPGQSFNAFNTRLHLFASDRERAVSILNDLDFSVDQHEVPGCPRCQSFHIKRACPRKEADSLLIGFFGIFLPGRKVNQCQDCGFEF